MTTAHLMLCVACLMTTTYPDNDQAQSLPSTPIEAYERAMEPLREFFKSEKGTMEDNIKAHKEKERRAKEYASLFKLSDWKGEQLFSLAQIYELAGQPADAEKAFGIYLLAPSAAKSTQARVSLLSVLVAQKKFAEALPIADSLLDEPKYNQDIIFRVKSLIEGLRKNEIKRAISIAEKMAPKLFEYAERNSGNPGHAGLLLSLGIEPGVMYRESGDQAKAEEYFAAFLSKFNASPVASIPRVKEIVEAAMFRLKLVGAAAPAIEGTEYVGLSKLKLSDLKGKVILLDFLAHWCGPCIASIPETNSLKEKYEVNGLVIIGLTNYYGFYGEREKLTNAEELTALREFMLKRNVKFGVIVGPRANEAAYGVAGLPAAALIDRKGIVRYIKEGADYKKEIEKIIQALLAEPALKQEGSI
jgi:thiol-disulfide isomerase/thioredoxin